MTKMVEDLQRINTELQAIIERKFKVWQLLETAKDLVSYIKHYAEEHNIPLRETYTLDRLLAEADQLLYESRTSPPNHKHPKRTPTDSTEYICVHKSLK